MGAAVPRQAEWRVRVPVMAAELPPPPAGGGSRWRDAKASATLAAVDHTGESWFSIDFSHPHTPTHTHTFTHTKNRHNATSWYQRTQTFHTLAACVNSSPRCSAWQQCRSVRQWIPLCQFTHSYLPWLVCQSGALPVHVNQFLWHLFLVWGEVMRRQWLREEC